jgi:tripartite-type tricarboxylate transporter receptor subunit TctC
MRASIFMLLAAGALATGVAAHAQSALNPGKVLRIVVPFAPGGANDVVARLLAQNWVGKVESTIVVENKTGAGGNIGTEFVAQSEPDGQTLLLVANQLTMAPVFKAQMNYNPRELVPVAKVGSQPVVIIVRKDLPVTTLAEFVDLARKRSGSEPLSFGSPGYGSPHQVFFEQMQRQLDVKMTHVPFRGIAPAVTEVLAGRIDMTFATENSAASLAANNSVRAIAVLGPGRVPSLPQLPTSAEAGFPNLRAGFWYALVAPAKTPKPLVDRFNDLVRDELKEPRFVQELAKRGIKPEGGSADEFAKDVTLEFAQWQQLADKGLAIESQ